MFKINLLANNEKYINEITTELSLWLGKEEQKIKKTLLNGIKNNSYPFTIIFENETELIGFYMIVKHDNDHTNYTPWLANLFIKKQYRKQGYGKILVTSIPSYMQRLNIKSLYLHTRLNNFYEKFGWKKLQKLDLKDGIIRNIYVLKGDVRK